MEKHVLVIGASMIDIKGRSKGAIYSRIKNPGVINITAGGVGRNIAENLARIGIKTLLLSAISEMSFCRFVLQETNKSGVDISRVLITEDNSSGIFMAIIDSRGELEASISDTKIMNKITVDYIKKNIDVFINAMFVVIDADIPDETLSFCLKMAKKNKIPVFVEPVSPSKAHCLLKYMRYINYITPNREELEVLAGKPVLKVKEIGPVAKEIRKKGIEYVIVTLGAEGVYLSSENYSGLVTSVPTVVEDSVGAGDALVAGVVAGLVKGNNIVESIKYGVAAATITLRTSNAVNPKIDLTRMNKLIKEIKFIKK